MKIKLKWIIYIIILVAIYVYMFMVPWTYAYSNPVPVVPKVFTAQELVQREFLNEPVMIRIAKAESNFDPLAKNSHSSAKGLYQILDGTWNGAKCQGSPLIALDNIACARKLYEARGTSDWNASKSAWNLTSQK